MQNSLQVLLNAPFCKIPCSYAPFIPKIKRAATWVTALYAPTSEIIGSPPFLVEEAVETASAWGRFCQSSRPRRADPTGVCRTQNWCNDYWRCQRAPLEGGSVDRPLVVTPFFLNFFHLVCNTVLAEQELSAVFAANFDPVGALVARSAEFPEAICDKWHITSSKSCAQS